MGTLAPGVPLPESLMQGPYFEHTAFQVIAPLLNNSAAIIAVNLNQDDETINIAIKPTDYAFAGGMIQPYKGLWSLPKEGFLLYDQYAQEALVLEKDYTFELTSREERLFQLSPIQNGWSIIGNPNKYLPASTYQILENNTDFVKIKLVENSSIMLWSDTKTPSSDNFIFAQKDNGLWLGILVKSSDNKEYIIVSL